jgi:hypothetical protein
MQFHGPSFALFAALSLPIPFALALPRATEELNPGQDLLHFQPWVWTQNDTTHGYIGLQHTGAASAWLNVIDVDAVFGHQPTKEPPVTDPPPFMVLREVTPSMGNIQPDGSKVLWHLGYDANTMAQYQHSALIMDVNVNEKHWYFKDNGLLSLATLPSAAYYRMLDTDRASKLTNDLQFVRTPMLAQGTKSRPQSSSRNQAPFLRSNAILSISLGDDLRGFTANEHHFNNDDPGQVGLKSYVIMKDYERIELDPV